ncbi:MAG: GH36-type glycosyl hydrolase domain-containing protein, partial [Candidatus Thorarchaeota archaeon]
MNGNGYFGEWITDEFGLPAYRYTCNQLTDPRAKTKTSYGFSTDHFHQLGNDRIMGTAHNGGYVQLLDGSRGFKWLTYNDDADGKLGGGIGLFCFENDKLSLSDLYTLENLNKVSKFERIFGVGYFQKKIYFKGIEILHNVCTPFSDDPVILSEYNISSNIKDLKNNLIKIVDFWDVNLYSIIKSLIVTWKNRKKFGTSKYFNFAGRFLTIILRAFKRDTESIRRAFASKFKYSVSYISELNTIVLTPRYKKNPRVAKTDPNKKDYYPKSLFLTIFDQKEVKFFFDKRSLFKDNEIYFDWVTNPDIKQIDKLNLCLSAGVCLNLNNNDKKKVISLFGYEATEKIEELVKKYRDYSLNKSILEWNAYNWKNTVINLKILGQDQLSNETIWHSYYTRSSLFYDDFYKNHRLYQGSIYLFGHGLDGSIRDYVLFLNSLIFINPKIAREFLLFILSLMLKDGRLPYALYGFGKTTSAFVHSKPSDLYLFLLWGIEQYVTLTRDFEFLEEFVPFYNQPQGIKIKISEKVKFLIYYLFSEKVGFGEHGLIKSNDGDWSDGISLMVKSRRKFIKYGESSFNSSFALYIIPRILNLLKNQKRQFNNSCREALELLKQSLFKSYNGKWFYRGWDGVGNPIGNNSLYLEHHTWLLISNVLDNEKALNLIDQIYNMLDKPSPIGQYISYPPEKTYLNVLPKGWDINGGIWHAMNALLTWAYSLYDEQKAFNSLIKNSLATRAENYPNIWYGIWSAPDSYIADYAVNSGEAFYHFATPMCDFPIMNLNAHASHLLSVTKISGIGADNDGLIIDPKIEDQEFTFKSPLISIEWRLDKCIIHYNVNAVETYNIKIKTPKWWNSQAKVYLNNILCRETYNLK